MKCLTVSQPYASLIAYGEKFVENRRWSTSYRGPLAIHAGKGTQYMSAEEMRREGYPTGSIVAVCYLVGCPSIVELEVWFGRAKCGARNYSTIFSHQYTEGPWCWVLENVRRLSSPIVYRGSLGLYDVPDYVLKNAEFVDV